MFGIVDIVSEPSTPDAYIYPDNKSKSISTSIYEKKINEKGILNYKEVKKRFL